MLGLVYGYSIEKSYETQIRKLNALSGPTHIKSSVILYKSSLKMPQKFTIELWNVRNGYIYVKKSLICQFYQVNAIISHAERLRPLSITGVQNTHTHSGFDLSLSKSLPKGQITRKIRSLVPTQIILQTLL